jgi:hypothetical protein
MPRFTLVTISTEGSGLHQTAKSLALQHDAPSFEWLVVAPMTTELAYTPQWVITENTDDYSAALQQAIHQAKGDYLWILPAGVCLADMYSLRFVQQHLAQYMGPDILYAPVRQGGVIETCGVSLLCAPITDLSSLVIKRPIYSSISLQEGMNLDQTSYMVQLVAFAQAKTTYELNRVICDVPQRPDLLKSLSRAEQYYHIRSQYTPTNRFVNRSVYQLMCLKILCQYRFKFIQGRRKRNRLGSR